MVTVVFSGYTKIHKESKEPRREETLCNLVVLRESLCYKKIMIRFLIHRPIAVNMMFIAILLLGGVAVGAIGGLSFSLVAIIVWLPLFFQLPKDTQRKHRASQRRNSV